MALMYVAFAAGLVSGVIVGVVAVLAYSVARL